jgi:hypothetical protein
MLRGLGLNPYELSPDQILDLENRNPVAGAIIENYGMYGASGVAVNLTTGYSFTDEIYGNVILSSDARGNLHIIGNSPVSPDVINQPVYTSPSGNSVVQSVEDLLTGLSSTVKLALVLGAGYLFFQMTRK